MNTYQLRLIPWDEMREMLREKVYGRPVYLSQDGAGRWYVYPLAYQSDPQPSTAAPMSNSVAVA